MLEELMLYKSSVNWHEVAGWIGSTRIKDFCDILTVWNNHSLIFMAIFKKLCMYSQTHTKGLIVRLIHFTRNHYGKNNWSDYPCGVVIHQCHRILLSYPMTPLHLVFKQTLIGVFTFCLKFWFPHSDLLLALFS